MAKKNVIIVYGDDEEEEPVIERKEEDDDEDEELRECLRLSLAEYQQQQQQQEPQPPQQQQKQPQPEKSIDGSKNSSGLLDVMALLEEKHEKARRKGLISPSSPPIVLTNDDGSDDESLKKALLMSLQPEYSETAAREFHPTSPDHTTLVEELALREAIILSLQQEALEKKSPEPKMKEPESESESEDDDEEVVVVGSFDPMGLIKNDGTSFYMNTLSGIDDDGNVGTVSFQKLVPHKGLRHCFLTSYFLKDEDLKWLNTVIPETVPKIIVKGWSTETDKEGVYVLNRYLTIVHPPFNVDNCTFHAKLSLLEYDADSSFPKGKIRVIISSANLSQHDWESIGQAIWFQDFPAKANNSPKTCEFEEYLTQFVKATLPPAYQDNSYFLKNYDFSSATAKLVVSIPGKFSVFTGKNNDKLADMQFGHMRLNQILQDFTWPEFIKIEGGPPKPPTPPVIIQASSLGMLQRKWLGEFTKSVAGAHCVNNKDEDTTEDADLEDRSTKKKKRGRSNKMQEWIDAEFVRRKARRMEEEATKVPPAAKGNKSNATVAIKEIPDIQIVFPSQNQTEQTVIKDGLGFLWLPERYYTELDTFPRNKFYECCPADPLRSVILHSKIITRMIQLPRGLDVGWLYVGSHNFSASAWGSLKLNNTMIELRNFEIGVVLLRPPPPDINTGRLSNSANQSTLANNECESLWAKLPFVFPPSQYSLRDKPFFSSRE
eukprot:TRINITY_DN10796_c0_g1_i2.p1 TRINITY_DN10796_c0_g1~~TRINITY_DN10796_c0_g1_i2.p1  ORF type:complete len:717 (-),score=172.19 TRINITY_DN10796_c0_g1_i2:30-2180(-)